MKILKVRRGFTTNSSGTNEWIPTQGTASPNASVDQTLPNATKVGGLVLLVALLISADQFLRKIWAKWHRQS